MPSAIRTAATRPPTSSVSVARAATPGLEGFGALWEELRAAGLDAGCRGGFDSRRRAVVAPTALDVDRMARLLARAERAAGDPLLGLHLATRAAGRGMLWHVARVQRSLGDALRALVELAGVVWGPFSGASLEEAGEAALLRYRLPDELPRHVVEYLVARTVIGLRIAGVRRVAVWFRHPRAAPVDAYEAVLRCAPRFRQAETRIVLPTADLERPIPTANPLLASALTSAIECLRARAPVTVAQRLADQVRVALHEERRCAREALARALGMSGKTLARRLEAEGRSFRDVVDDVRRARAQQLLEDRRLDLAEIADRAGFADLTAFGKAFRRWFAMTPSAYRRRMSAADESSSVADERELSGSR
jgi:AraC-like DNA-binding protein